MVHREDRAQGWGARDKAPLCNAALPTTSRGGDGSPGAATWAKASASLGPGGAEGGRYRGKPHMAHGIAPVVDVIRVPKVEPGCLEERKLGSG